MAVDAATLVTGSSADGEREITRNSPIFRDDRLSATTSGNAQIILVDKTKIVVGPGAQVDIDNFVFNSDDTFKTVTIRATKGAFRFVSGNSGNSAYKIETPSGTIGVRGTAFDVGITGDQMHVVMVRGEVQMSRVAASASPARTVLLWRDGQWQGRSGGQSAHQGPRRKSQFPSDER